MSQAEAAAILPLSLSTDTATIGQTVYAHFNAAAGSRAIVSVENSARVISVNEYEITQPRMQIPIEVTEAMEPNVYVHVTLLQPYARSYNDCPIRLYGIVPLVVQNSGSRLQPIIGMKDELKPEERYTVQVKEKSGRSMSYSLAIVDEGLLSITSFRTPDPWQAFHAREALGVRTWDMYSYILGAYGGRISQLFSIGGDGELNLSSKSMTNRFAPVVVFKGPFLLEKGKTNTHELEMPNYNGNVHVMVVATDGNAFGSTDKQVPVKSDVQLLGTLPRVLGCDEACAIPVTVFAGKNGIGEITLSLECGNGLSIAGESTKKVSLPKQGDLTVSFRVSSHGQTGAIPVRVKAKYRDGSTSYETELLVENKESEVVHWKNLTIESGKTATFLPENFGISGTNRLALEAGGMPSINLDARLTSLIHYAHGCVEQTSSKGIALIHAQRLRPASGEGAETADQTVNYLLERLRNYQTASGGLAYWPGNATPDEWGSAYGLDFLQQAALAGYKIPEGLKKSLHAYVSNAASSWQPDQANEWYRSSRETTQAYRLWVLASDNHADIGAMNRLKAIDSLNDEARWLLAGAYAMTGRSDVAGELLGLQDKNDAYTPGYDLTYGSDTRLCAIKAATLTLLKRYGEAATYITSLSNDLAGTEWLSTQSVAMGYLAIDLYYQHAGKPAASTFSVSYNGKEEKVTGHEGLYQTLLDDGADKLGKVVVKNQSPSVLFVQLAESGLPKRSNAAAYGNGLSLTVGYTQAGKSVDVSQLDGGSNFTANVTLRNGTSLPLRNLAIEQIMPSGWEILSNRFNESDAATDAVSYQDIRDNRIYSYVNELGAGAAVSFSVKLCATYSGTFYLPPVSAYAMYDEKTRANTASQQVTVK